MPTFTAEIIISFSDLNHNKSVIPKYSKMQECTRFERFRKKKYKKKKKRKKKKRKKEKRKSTKAWVWVIFYPLRAYKSINYEWSLLFLTRRASRGALTSSLFHFLFFCCYFTLATDFAEREGTPCSLSAPKMFLKHENHALSRARVWRHGKGSNNTIPSPPSYSQSLVLIPFIMLEGLKGVLRSMVFGQFTVSSFLYN